MPYKKLLLNKDKIDGFVAQFIKEKGYSIDDDIESIARGKRISFGKAGSEFAMVDLLFVKSGATTVQWKIGRNQPLGKELAEYLKSTIEPDQIENIFYSLSGIIENEISPVFDQASEDGNFDFTVSSNNEKEKKVVLESKKNQDSITITHYKTTNKLLIQGKPLSSYRFFIYLLAELLDLSGLEKVLCRKDDGAAEIVREEVALDYLKGAIPCTFEDIPKKVRDLLIAGCCVKLAAPSLPEYSMLLFPDLRALEGVIRRQMSRYSMNVGGTEHGFGEYFAFSEGIATLKDEYVDVIDNSDMIDALNKGYTFLRKHRNTLFHMDDFTESSRTIDTLDKAIELSKETYILIGKLMQPSDQDD